MRSLDRTYEALVLAWDVTSGPSAARRALARRLMALSPHYVDVAIISGAPMSDLLGLFGRPAGPGRMFLAPLGGSELFQVDLAGPHLIWRHRASPTEEAALDRAATLGVELLIAEGLPQARWVAGLNRRRISLLAEPIGSGAVGESEPLHVARTGDSGTATLASLLWRTTLASKQAGLFDPRVTTDGWHLEIGLTDSSDCLRQVLRRFLERGVGPGLTLVIGSQFGTLEGVPGKDSLLLVPEAAGATAVSVGPEPSGPPAEVRHLPGGSAVIQGLLDEQLRRRRGRRVPWIDEDPAWVLSTLGRDPQRARVEESLLSLGDGVIGLRGSHEETRGGELPMLLAAGVYTGQGPAQHLLEGPWPLSLALGGRPLPERRLLDLRTGVLVRADRSTDTDEDEIRTIRFVAAHRRGVVGQRAEAAGGRIAPGPPWRSSIDHPTTSGTTLGDRWARSTGERGGIASVVTLKRGQDGERRTVERLATFVSDPHRPPPVSRAAAGLARLKGAGFERLLAEHRATWAQRWQDACVWIPDDPGAQLAVRWAMFQMWSNVATQGESAVGARGLTGPGYGGHVFWDSDVFVLPAMASLSPSAARAMLEYRLRRLQPARTNARLRGLDGARFPWESAADGYDVTPPAARVNGRWTPILTGQQEEHIVADVAWSACHYADWTGDHGFLTGPGRELVTDTARYWESRVQPDERGRGHIRHVIGPDEYHEDVDDNVFTNVMARWNLRRAAALTSSPDESARWLSVADSLVDGYDVQSNRHEQFAGYDTLEPLLATEIGTPPLAADLLLGATRIAHSQIIKQPDVLMAHHMLPAEMPSGSLAADLDYYLPRTAHGSSLSPAVAASLLARAGRPDEALELLDIALRLDLDDLTGVTSAGLHLATLGGVWQALLVGFAGLRVDAGSLSVDPRLPSRWGSLRLRFRCLGRRVELRLTPGSALVTTSKPLAIRTPGHQRGPETRQAHLVNTDSGWVVQT